MYFLSLLRSYQLEVHDQTEKNNCKCTPVKSDSKGCKTTIWSAEKQNVEKTIIKNEQSPLSMQAVPLAGSIFISPLGSYQLEFQGQLKTNKCIRILEKSDSKEC